MTLKIRKKNYNSQLYPCNERIREIMCFNKYKYRNSEQVASIFGLRVTASIRLSLGRLDSSYQIFPYLMENAIS